MESFFDFPEFQQHPHSFVKQPALDARLVPNHFFQCHECVFEVAIAQHSSYDKIACAIRKVEPARLHVFEYFVAEEVIGVDCEHFENAFTAPCIQLDFRLSNQGSVRVVPEAHFFEHFAQLARRACFGVDEAMQ